MDLLEILSAGNYGTVNFIGTELYALWEKAELPKTKKEKTDELHFRLNGKENISLRHLEPRNTNLTLQCFELFIAGN